MKSWTKYCRAGWTRRFLVGMAGAAMALSLASFEFEKPVRAVAPAAAALDDNSVNALLSVDQAMETLAARVTPAVVNVTVTSKRSGDRWNPVGGTNDGNGDSDGPQPFFGPFGRPFG